MGREFVFVHGMSHGAWCWEPLVRRLERRGHRTLAVDLPGHGRRAHEWRRASVTGYARAVADDLAAAGFSAAVVLPHGSSLLETHIPAPGRPRLEGLARSGGGLVQYPAALEHARWMGDLAAGDPRVIDALTRITPQPFGPLAERVDLRRFQALGVSPIDLDTAHGPMLSDPEALVAVLERV